MKKKLPFLYTYKWCNMCFLYLLLFLSTNISAQSLKVMSFNTRMSGQMTEYEVAPFATFIRKHNPDVVMLQEVDFKTKRNGYKDFSTQLAAELGMFSIFGKAINSSDGEYGVAILSKYPFIAINNQVFEGIDGVKETRTLLYVDIETPENKNIVRLACTHLDHSTDIVRSAMAEQINERIGSGDIPTILAGDFNAVLTSNAISVVMKHWQRICNDALTYPADQPTSKIDYIFGLPNGKWSVKSYKVVSNADISDHAALIAEVEYLK